MILLYTKSIYILRIHPPLLPVLGIISRNGNIANGSIKPDVEDLVLISLERDGGTPLEVSGNATRLQTIINPTLGNEASIITPITFLTRSTGLLVHTMDVVSTHCFNCCSNWGKSKKRCVVDFFSTIWSGPPTLQRGWINSVAFNRFPHLSHWSPPAFS